MLGLGLCWAAPLTARAEEKPAVVWYRASEHCPNGTDFLARLADKSTRARLAEPADHFDFLVTLVEGGKETIGRLERQTRSGTVAIRELSDSSCERVADALALGLSLALEPAALDQAPHDAESTPPPGATTATAPATVAPPPTPAPSPPEALRDPSSDRRAPTATATPPQWGLGLAAGVLEGAVPSPLLQGFAFVDFTRTRPTPSWALRIGVLGATGSVSTQVGDVEHRIVAGRVEGCPWRFGSNSAGIWPCAAFELGQHAATGARDSALSARDLWLAPGALLRLSYALATALALEAQAGAAFPLVRDTVYAGQEPLYKTEIIAFQASAGVSARLW